MRVGSAILAASFVLFTSRSVPVVYGGTVLLALGNGLLWPSLLAVLSKATDPKVQGAVQGFAGSAGAVASIIGLVVGGLLYGVLGGIVFALSAAITLLVFAVTLVPIRRAAVRDRL
jgi:MFS family permease